MEEIDSYLNQCDREDALLSGIVTPSEQRKYLNEVMAQPEPEDIDDETRINDLTIRLELVEDQLTKAVGRNVNLRVKIKLLQKAIGDILIAPCSASGAEGEEVQDIRDIAANALALLSEANYN